MFKSIRWRFITIYLLLIFLAMSIIGFYLTNQLEKIQLDSITQSMKGHISSILASSTALQSEDWADQAEGIREMVEKNVQIGYDENLYIILNTDDKRIIASSISSVVSLSAFESNRINNLLVLEALKGEIVETITSVSYDGVTEKIKHMAYPVKNNDGIIEGIIYLTYKLDAVYAIVEDTTFMMTRATILALFVTVILGFFLANSITGPIKDVTRKASEMSKGNFDQSVEVMSNDEIGQLAIMFNFLTQELKKNISKVYQEKSKMETTFNYMADGVITFNLDGSMIHANPVARKILDIDETLEIDGEKLLSGIDYQLSLMVLKEYHYTGRTMVNINDYIYNINYAPFRNEVDEIGGVIFVIQDITEQQKLENMRKEFVANVSHELKTPITTIKSYTETLLEGDIDSKETVQSFLKVINNESERMSRLVGDLLRLSRIEYNQTDWNKVIINPCEVLAEVIEKFSLVISEKNQTIAYESVNEHIDVLFDKDGLEQVFQNIISNAVKYTPEEGFIKINCYKNENNAIICIKDNGIGISDEHRKRIFERFYRVDQARSRDNGGTGLGLAIVKRILEAHHATIEVDSVVDEGTEFRIIIPTVHRGEEYA
jgi:two-component system, OmpR family, sensor histidine kinase VicK